MTTCLASARLARWCFRPPPLRSCGLPPRPRRAVFAPGAGCASRHGTGVIGPPASHARRHGETPLLIEPARHLDPSRVAFDGDNGDSDGGFYCGYAALPFTTCPNPAAATICSAGAGLCSAMPRAMPSLRLWVDPRTGRACIFRPGLGDDPPRGRTASAPSRSASPGAFLASVAIGMRPASCGGSSEFPNLHHTSNHVNPVCLFGFEVRYGRDEHRTNFKSSTLALCPYGVARRHDHRYSGRLRATDRDDPESLAPGRGRRAWPDLDGEAENLLQAAVALAPDSIGARFDLAWAFYRLTARRGRRAPPSAQAEPCTRPHELMPRCSASGH